MFEKDGWAHAVQPYDDHVGKVAARVGAQALSATTASPAW
ncbi:hypothetical protein BRPE64_BCDS06480 [Caballeronia insecticola]|uniref:Uncharacterized protein n=1 Tax=Caballeronia insecticola TaxID=758793 RepID=R4WLH2_9BURK|nr:hypothetical protein BRPE64_BCDS06480 [Caballeronia insecticola]